jgi:hypothetical protein
MTPAKSPLPFLGTWKLTSCESSHPDLPHPVSGITTFAEEPGAIRYTNEGAWSNGTKTDVQAVLQLDGSWCPITGSLLADSISVETTSDGLTAKMRKAGVDVGTTRAVVSADRRTTTGTWEIAGPGGITVKWKTTTVRV